VQSRRIDVKVLVVDVGGTHVKLLATGRTRRRQFDSGPELTPALMVAGVVRAAKGWAFDRIAIGYPGAVRNDRPIAEPHNLAPGWVDFDYAKAFGRPVRMVNDAAMQALGAYRGGRLLFLGFGTGLGSAMIVDHVLVPMELAHLPYRKTTFEDYVGLRGLRKFGRKEWRAHAADVVERLMHALLPDDVVLGGGNARLLRTLPPLCRLGGNEDAFAGGFRLWESVGARRRSLAPSRRKGARA
jgi:polyphosphate glucokinase